MFLNYLLDFIEEKHHTQKERFKVLLNDADNYMKRANYLDLITKLL